MRAPLRRPYEPRPNCASLPYAAIARFRSPAPLRPADALPQGCSMLDLLYLGLGLAFFAGCAWYVFLTERL